MSPEVCADVFFIDSVLPQIEMDMATCASISRQLFQFDSPAIPVVKTVKPKGQSDESALCVRRWTSLLQSPQCKAPGMHALSFVDNAETTHRLDELAQGFIDDPVGWERE